ncbi:MAG: penicillin-binding transpeptidase domain-containing protein [Mycobacteriales bacterium]
MSGDARRRPSRQPPGRLLLLGAVVIALVATVGVRLTYVQLVQRASLTQVASRQHLREVTVPAPRGRIVDATGQPIATSRTVMVVSVDTSTLQGQRDKGRAVLGRLAVLLRVPVQQLSREVTPCAPKVPKPCFTGTPYQPVPVLVDADEKVVLEITEHREDYAGVLVGTASVRTYPRHTLASHSIGYIGAAAQSDVDSTAASDRPVDAQDVVGKSGLEQYYDAVLRGTDGIDTVEIDPRGTVIGQVDQKSPVPGDTLVSSLDVDLQSAVENALTQQLAKARTETDPKTHQKYQATTGAVVVMDPKTGRVLALASDPGYDPNEFVGGISQQQYAALTSERAGTPLLSRAVQGQLAPGSTFKLSTATAITTDGQSSLDANGACPPYLTIGTTQKKNFESESLPGPISLSKALAFSCDTFFYAYALQTWQSDQQRVAQQKPALEPMQKTATEYGFGARPGIDLPADEQAAGTIITRAKKQRAWERNQATYCARARTGYPEVTDPTRRAYFTKLARENCTDGWRYNGGDAADFAIGQGDVLVSPLQLAIAYSALVNGGTVYHPTLGRAIVNPHGRLIRNINATVARKLDVPAPVLDYIRASLTFGNGLDPTGQPPFAGFPLDTVNIGGKTGTAEVYGQQDTSWFVSWANAGHATGSTLGPDAGTPDYVVVAMIQHGGTGATNAAPLVRKVYDSIYGLDGQASVLPGGVPFSALPAITPYAQDGLPSYLIGRAQPRVARSADPTSRSADPTSRPGGTALPAVELTFAPAVRRPARPPAALPSGPRDRGSG